MSPCPQCTRHIRLSEDACPFCGAALPPEFTGRVAPDTTRRLGRAAAFTFGAMLTVAGCGASTSPAPPPDTGTADTGVADTGPSPQDVQPADTGAREDIGNVAPPYGIPPPRDAGLVDDAGAPMAEYGSPPPPRDAATSDVGGPVAAYGAPPPRDAGPDDAGSFKADYGAPPPRDAGR